MISEKKKKERNDLNRICATDCVEWDQDLRKKTTVLWVPSQKNGD